VDEGDAVSEWPPPPGSRLVFRCPGDGEEFGPERVAEHLPHGQPECRIVVPPVPPGSVPLAPVDEAELAPLVAEMIAEAEAERRVRPRYDPGAVLPRRRGVRIRVRLRLGWPLVWIKTEPYDGPAVRVRVQRVPKDDHER
jgi:hypothetical protein